MQNKQIITALLALTTLGNTMPADNLIHAGEA